MLAEILAPDIFRAHGYDESSPLLSKYSFILSTVCFFLQTTSGGTESLLLACKTYRDWAKEEKGIIKPEM